LIWKFVTASFTGSSALMNTDLTLDNGVGDHIIRQLNDVENIVLVA
jgi:hypothetical protein